MNLSRQTNTAAAISASPIIRADEWKEACADSPMTSEDEASYIVT